MELNRQNVIVLAVSALLAFVVVAALLVRILTIVTLARLLTLSCRTISYALASVGDRHLGAGKFRRYWERVTRLLPFGERCFEAAVYIMAAAMCVREIAPIGNGDR